MAGTNKRCGTHVSDYENKKYFGCSLLKGHKGSHGEFPEKNRQGAYPKSKSVRCLGWTVGAKDGCGRVTKVSKIDYIQTFWYTEPYGCVGGDYWNEGEGQFVCPKCGALNRLYERPEVVRLRGIFRNIIDRHKRN
jgi:hypothetical protein